MMKTFNQFLTVALLFTSYAMMATGGNHGLKTNGLDYLQISHIDSVYQEVEKAEDDVRFSNSEIIHFERALMKIRINQLIVVDEEPEAGVQDIIFSAKEDKQ